MITFSIRLASKADQTAVLALAERLGEFGPTTRSSREIAEREARALAGALADPSPDSPLLVADHEGLGLVGILLLESRRDYFTDEAHGHVSILAVAREAEGQGIGRALLGASEEWARRQGYKRLTLAVFTENRRARELYVRQGWRPELETYYKTVE